MEGVSEKGLTGDSKKNDDIDKDKERQTKSTTVLYCTVLYCTVLYCHKSFFIN